MSFRSEAQVKLVSFSEINDRVARGKDTVYVVNFWATWCAPCVSEMPNFEKLQKTKFSQPVKVILLSLDFKSKLQTVVNPFVKKHHPQTEVALLSEDDLPKMIQRVDRNWSGAIPATLIVNAQNGSSIFCGEPLTYRQLTDSIKTVLRRK